MLSKSSISALLKSEGFKKYFQNTSWLFLERVLRMGIALLVGAYVARFLGPEFFGELNYARGFVGLFTAFTALGIDGILVRDLVRNPEQRNLLLGTAFGLKFFGALVVILLIGATLFVKGIIGQAVDSYTVLLIFIIASGEIFRAFGVIDFYYQSKVKSKYVVKIQMIQVFINATVRILLIWFEAPLHYFAMMIAMEAVIIAIGLIYVYLQRGHKIFRWKFERKIAFRILSESWPLALYGLALHVQARIDQVMLGDMIGKEEVGQYSVALTMIEALGVIPVVVQNSFAPAITKGKMQGEDVYRDRRLNFYRLMFVIFLLTALPTFFLAEFGIVLLFGGDYRPAGILLSLFAIRMFFTSMGLAKSTFITNESLFKHSLFTAIIGAVVNIGVNYMLIPEFQSRGAIVATIVSFSVSIFLLDFFFRATSPNMRLMWNGIFTFWKISKVR